jgi:hypothetical protein
MSDTVDAFRQVSTKPEAISSDRRNTSAMSHASIARRSSKHLLARTPDDGAERVFAQPP